MVFKEAKKQVGELGGQTKFGLVWFGLLHHHVPPLVFLLLLIIYRGSVIPPHILIVGWFKVAIVLFLTCTVFNYDELKLVGSQVVISKNGSHDAV